MIELLFLGLAVYGGWKAHEKKTEWKQRRHLKKGKAAALEDL